MSGYTQTLLLDCNRLSSEEYNASRLSDTDNSLYTNKVANGINLNIGDQISINSAYISERGAGAEVIEFKGKRLGQNTQITYTNVSNTSFVGYTTYNNDYVMPAGYGRQNFENVTESLAIQDNEVSIAVQFYKTTNGEMNISLPRRFGSVSPGGVNYTTAEKYWTTPDADDTGMNVFFRNASHIYAPDWNECELDSWQQYITASHQKPRPPTFGSLTGLPAITINGSAIARKLKQDNSRFTIFVRKETIWNGSFVQGDTPAERDAFKQNYLNSLVFNEDIDGAFITTSLRDPALKEYIPFMKKVDLSVKEGYDTPSRIASQLTDKLAEVQDIDPLIHSHRGATSLDPGGQDVYSRTVDSTLYQNFPAANETTFSTSRFESFREGILAPPGETEDLSEFSFAYLNNYAYVGFKRPEFVMKGRELNDNAGFHIIEDLFTAPTIGDQPASDIKTSLEWNEDNLTKLRDFFEVQRKFYPELISGNRETNSSFTASFVEEYYGAASASLNASFEDVARFLHINPYSASTLADSLIYNGSTTCLQHRFNVSSAGCTIGNEMNYMDSSPLTYNGSGISQAFSASNENIYNKYAYDTSSLPIYIYYNASSAHLTSADSDGNGDHNLVYGFARKTTGILSHPTITFTTTGINGIALCHFNDGARDQYNRAPTGSSPGFGWPFIQGTQIKGSHYAQGGARRLGYDYHFNAYGNAAIIPSTGYNRTGYYGHQQKVGYNYARRCYLGANNPLLNFNTVDNRFEFKNLHTSEKIGNMFNAGDPDPTGNEIAPPPADQSSQDCYKINKIDQYNTWSPCMMPYPEINVLKKANVSHTFPKPNVNLERETVMDAHCGITIADMGVTEELWDESIWGILGFSYRQFYPNASVVGNINTRMNNVITNVSGATTNALISSVDGLEYQVNPFAVNLFTTQIPLATDYGETANWMISGGGAGTIVRDINTIVVNAVSTAITADNLPRKQLRGYFLLSSNIMNDANYFREANPMAVMAVVDKYNAEGDFINYSGGGTVFTVTKPTTLTSVRTAILDPDGSPAQVGQYSGVIYRIDKQVNTDLNFAQTLMEQQQK